MHIFLLLCTIAHVLCTTPIKNVIVLMEENRSFDHMLGHLKNDNPEIDGLTGRESNPLNPQDPHSLRVRVSFDAEPYIETDPGHSFEQTLREIWGSETFTNPAPMNGFLWENHEDRQVMRAYNKSTVPIISQLALEYAVFDRWYSSVPGPTQPNRLMLHSCTAHGNIRSPTWEDWVDGEYAPERTIFNDIYDSGKTWKIYFSDFPVSLELTQLRYFPLNILPITEFYKDAENGNLPDYAFLEPRWFDFLDWKENDQHPPHSVTYGEYLIKDVYESMRKSPQWNTSLLVIMYDEHGGLYDHVSPVQENVPSPDDIENPIFKFNRLGVRVPVVMISPWIAKGLVEHDPPTPPSKYDHTSIAHTLRKILPLKQPPLTKREAWSGTFEHIFLKSIREDCPVTLDAYNHKEFEEYKKMERTLVGDLECKDAQPVSNLQQDVLTVAWSLMRNTLYIPYVCQSSQYVRLQLEEWFKNSSMEK